MKRGRNTCFPNLKSVLSRDKTSLGSYFKDEFKLCRTELKQLGLFRFRQGLAAISLPYTSLRPTYALPCAQTWPPPLPAHTGPCPRHCDSHHSSISTQEDEGR